MLKELENPRQIEGDDFRRIFSGDNLRLYVWYNSQNIQDENEITGFQLCFEEGDEILHEKKSLIWKRRGGYILENDDGVTGTFSASSVLVSNFKSNPKELSDKFSNSGKEIKDFVINFISKKISEYK